MVKFDTKTFREDLPAFKEKCAAFFNGEVDKGAYKGFSGFYGSYSQRGGQASMLRLRMTAGRLTKAKLAFVADMIRAYDVPRAHFTTCQTIQFHDLDVKQTCEIMEKALDAGIVTIGGGGDFPRNVMCAPLTGTEPNEYFDVMPYAEAAADFLMGFVKAEKMPRKLKVAFSNSPANAPHATYRDLGFAARADGKFDVYSAGGLGNNPRFGVKVAEAIDPNDILFYIKAMWLTFRAYGNYENRGKARTRYMVEKLGGEENYRAAYNEKLQQVLGEDLKLDIAPAPIAKTGDGSAASGKCVLPQKQEGLYTVVWHPLGGMPDLKILCALSDMIADMDAVEGRITPEEAVCIVNLTGAEAERVAALVAPDNAATLFETSVACIGAATCQVGVRDSQSLIQACAKAVREAAIPDGALPQIHISGCPSSCGTHQTGRIGFRGAAKRVNGAPVSAFMLFVGGESAQGKEQMGRELGAIAESDIPAFLVELGQTVAASGKDYEGWLAADPSGVDAIAQKYI